VQEEDCLAIALSENALIRKNCVLGVNYYTVRTVPVSFVQRDAARKAGRVCAVSHHTFHTRLFRLSQMNLLFHMSPNSIVQQPATQIYTRNIYMPPLLALLFAKVPDSFLTSFRKAHARTHTHLMLLGDMLMAQAGYF
jgi:hypothetical protein